MRMIDADALKYRRKEFGGYDDVPMEERKKGILYLLKEDIDDALTIDPVKHGKWEYHKYRYGNKEAEKIGVYKCTVCGHANWIKEDNYCPNCGASMKEEYE